MWRNLFRKVLGVFGILFMVHMVFLGVHSSIFGRSYGVVAGKLTKIIPPGWKLMETVKDFTPENLYEHINGRAEFFLGYGVVQMTFATYIHERDAATFIDVSVYDMASPANAFGVYTAERPKVFQPVDVNRAGYRSGANIFIWKGPYYVRMITSDDSSRLQRINVELAQKLSNSLHDSGESLWGLNALPTVDRVPGSERYFLQDAMGLDFMTNTYMAQYRKNGTILRVFLSKTDNTTSAREVLRLYKEYGKQMGQGLKEIHRNGVVISLYDMGGSYDAIFQNGDVVAGVNSVNNPLLAVDMAYALWQHLNAY